MSSFSSSGVWSRTDDGSSTMSKNLYAFAVGGFTFLGILASFGAAQFTTNLKFSSGWELLFTLILPVMVAAIVGILIAMKSDNPFVSLIGYALVAIPFGLMLGPVVAMYTTASVVKVLFITTLLVAVLSIVGTVIPDNLEGFGSWLFAGLIVLLAGYLIVPLTGLLGFNIGGALTVLDWIGVVIFAGLVVYDWNRAMRLNRTLDNAVDSAIAVYLDWFNIFVRLLSLMGGSSKSD